MTVRLRATLADGRVFEGPVQGYGGKLGSGALHAGRQLATREALRRLALAQRLHARGRELNIFEPEPGCVAIYPSYSAESDGPCVAVPLLGTTWEAVGDDQEDECLEGGTCVFSADLEYDPSGETESCESCGRLRGQE